MFYGSLGLSENVTKEHSDVEIRGEAFPLEENLLEQMDDGWKIETYLDNYQIEHIRVCKVPDVLQEETQLWDVFSFDGEEVPLELLLEIELDDI